MVSKTEKLAELFERKPHETRGDYYLRIYRKALRNALIQPNESNRFTLDLIHAAIHDVIARADEAGLIDQEDEDEGEESEL